MQIIVVKNRLMFTGRLVIQNGFPTLGARLREFLDDENMCLITKQNGLEIHVYSDVR